MCGGRGNVGWLVLFVEEHTAHISPITLSQPFLEEQRSRNLPSHALESVQSGAACPWMSSWEHPRQWSSSSGGPEPDQQVRVPSIQQPSSPSLKSLGLEFGMKSSLKQQSFVFFFLFMYFSL